MVTDWICSWFSAMPVASSPPLQTRLEEALEPLRVVAVKHLIEFGFSPV
jgi:hypothetical protein